LAGKDKAKPKDHGKQSHKKLPPETLIKPLDSVSSSTSRIKKVDGNSDQHTSEQILKSWVANDLNFLVPMNLHSLAAFIENEIFG
jgi:hypothetical protein